MSGFSGNDVVRTGWWAILCKRRIPPSDRGCTWDRTDGGYIGIHPVRGTYPWPKASQRRRLSCFVAHSESAFTQVHLSRPFPSLQRFTDTILVSSVHQPASRLARELSEYSPVMFEIKPVQLCTLLGSELATPPYPSAPRCCCLCRHNTPEHARHDLVFVSAKRICSRGGYGTDRESLVRLQRGLGDRTGLGHQDHGEEYRGEAEVGGRAEDV